MHQKYTDYDTKHITPDMTEADIILPTIHFSKKLNYNLEWHSGNIEQRQEDRQQWTMQEAANVAMEELAEPAWEEDFEAIHHNKIAPHCRDSTAIQMILPNGSVSSNLDRTIPEAITTIQGKPKLQETLKMTTEQMVIIDEEILSFLLPLE